MQSDAGVSGYSTRFRRKNKWMKGFRKILAPQHISSVVQTRITAPLSRQQPYLVSAYTGASSTTPYLLGNVDTNDCQAVLQALEPTAGTQTSTNNNTYATRRMMLHSIKAKYTFKNQTNAPIDVTLYDVTARRDASTSGLNPITAWDNGLLDQGVSLPGTTSSNPQTSTFPGGKPFQSQTFCQFWNVKRVSHFVLGAGSTHQHYITIRPGYLLNAEYTRQMQFFKGLTTVLMAVVKGTVAQDTATPFNVSYSSAELDCICETQYRFTAMERARTAYIQYSTLPVSMTTPATVLEDTDAVAPIAQV